VSEGVVENVLWRSASIDTVFERLQLQSGHKRTAAENPVESPSASIMGFDLH
jgi:hypothetical protein